MREIVDWYKKNERYEELERAITIREEEEDQILRKKKLNDKTNSSLFKRLRKARSGDFNFIMKEFYELRVEDLNHFNHLHFLMPEYRSLEPIDIDVKLFALNKYVMNTLVSVNFPQSRLKGQKDILYIYSLKSLIKNCK